MEAATAAAMQCVCATWASIEQHGALHFRTLPASDRERLLIRAQILFQASVFLPAFVYYGCHIPDGTDTRFPATISWSIRRGAPKYLQHGLWLAGWYNVCTAIVAAGDYVGLTFAVVMVCTGVVGVVICPVGASTWQDICHYVAAALYMVDHFVLIAYLGMGLCCLFGFSACLAGFTIATRRVDRIRSQMQKPSDRLTKSVLSSQLYWAEAKEMAFEYGMFVIFIAGMTSRTSQGMPQNTSVISITQALSVLWPLVWLGADAVRGCNHIYNGQS